MLIVLLLFSSYLIGSVPCGFIIGKLNKIDIRQKGSGNIGATNILRIVGKKWGYSCFFLDFLKGLLAVYIANYFGDFNIALLSLIFVIIGHMYSVFIGFKGGKGVATCLGGLIFLFPLPFLALIISWVVIFCIFGYVSLASILVGGLLPVFGIIEKYLNNEKILTPSMAILFILGIAIIIKHNANIHRLMTGKEISFKKKVKE